MKRAVKMMLTTMLAWGLTSAVVLAEDLSKYRAIQLGSDLSTVAKQTGVSPAQIKVVHQRPVLIQELEWRSAGTDSQPTRDVLLTFYDGQLFRVVVQYDRQETEGLTADDMIEAISRTYGVVAHKTSSPKAAADLYSDEEKIIAQWEDAEHHFDLIHSSYGGRYSLAGVLKRLEGPAAKAIAEAARLDYNEAPQREIDRIAADAASDRLNLEKARVANKPKFTP
jgi:hypothetical protein